MNDFEAECRRKFEHYCKCRARARYNYGKRHFAAKAYEVIDAYLDWQAVQSL